MLVAWAKHCLWILTVIYFLTYTLCIPSLIPRQCVCWFPLPDESHLHTVWTGTACPLWSVRAASLINWSGQTRRWLQHGTIKLVIQYTYSVLRNMTKLTTRGGTSPDCVEMTLTQEWKSTHQLRMPQLKFLPSPWQDARLCIIIHYNDKLCVILWQD